MLPHNKEILFGWLSQRERERERERESHWHCLILLLVFDYRRIVMSQWQIFTDNTYKVRTPVRKL